MNKDKKFELLKILKYLNNQLKERCFLPLDAMTKQTNLAIALVEIEPEDKLINFLKWASRNYIKLDISYSSKNRVAISISNSDDEKVFLCGLGNNIEEAIEDLQDSIVNLGYIPIKYDNHRVVYDFPWDK